MAPPETSAPRASFKGRGLRDAVGHGRFASELSLHFFLCRLKGQTLNGWQVHVLLLGTPIYASPFLVQARPGKPHAPSCLASGLGLGSAVAGAESLLALQISDAAHDAVSLDTSSDVLDITLQSTGAHPQHISFMPSGGVGAYAARYVPKSSGLASLCVLLNKEHITGSPFAVAVSAGLPDPAKCSAAGDGLSSGRAGEVSEFFLTVRSVVDELVDLPDLGAASIEILCITTADTFLPEPVRGRREVPASVTRTELGTYAVQYTPEVSGPCIISISVMRRPIRNSPFTAIVQPGPADPPSCLQSGPGLHDAMCGEDALFIVAVKDKFGNAVRDANLEVNIDYLDHAKMVDAAVEQSACRVTRDSVGSGIWNAERASKPIQNQDFPRIFAVDSCLTFSAHEITILHVWTMLFRCTIPSLVERCPA